MADNKNAVVDQMPPAPPAEDKKPSLGARFVAGLKEWLRKQVVTLKRTPQRIPMFFICLTSVLFLVWLFDISQAAYAMSGINFYGLVVFVLTLLSILIIPLFLNAFPKRQKPNFIFIALVFVFMAAIVVLDICYYQMAIQYLYVDGRQNAQWIADRPFIAQSFTYIITHIVFVGISALSLALMPVYAPLIKKINTSKNVEGNDISETIDIEDAE